MSELPRLVPGRREGEARFIGSDALAYDDMSLRTESRTWTHTARDPREFAARTES